MVSLIFLRWQEFTYIFWYYHIVEFSRKFNNLNNFVVNASIFLSFLRFLGECSLVMFQFLMKKVSNLKMIS